MAVQYWERKALSLSLMAHWDWDSEGASEILELSRVKFLRIHRYFAKRKMTELLLISDCFLVLVLNVI